MRTRLISPGSVRSRGLAGYELPRSVLVEPSPMTIESGLLTASGKLALGLTYADSAGTVSNLDRIVQLTPSTGAYGGTLLRDSIASGIPRVLYPFGAKPDYAKWLLDDPRVNVTLGTHYLALLVARFGEPAAAVAAYNAGPAPAAAWATARAGMPLDAWVESIPYRETRQYVKIVMSEWAAYRALEGEPPPPIDPGRKVTAPGPGVAF